jgi:hypothetical protein
MEARKFFCFNLRIGVSSLILLRPKGLSRVSERKTGREDEKNRPALGALGRFGHESSSSRGVGR